MDEYTCYTKQGKWNFFADSPKDALRLGLFYAWRNGEDFERVEYRKGSQDFTLRLLLIDNKTHDTFTL